MIDMVLSKIKGLNTILINVKEATININSSIKSLEHFLEDMQGKETFKRIK
jgi:hypothetical protein